MKLATAFTLALLAGTMVGYAVTGLSSKRASASRFMIDGEGWTERYAWPGPGKLVEGYLTLEALARGRGKAWQLAGWHDSRRFELTYSIETSSGKFREMVFDTTGWLENGQRIQLFINDADADGETDFVAYRLGKGGELTNSIYFDYNRDGVFDAYRNSAGQSYVFFDMGWFPVVDGQTFREPQVISLDGKSVTVIFQEGSWKLAN